MTVKQLKDAIVAAKRLEDHPNSEERLQLQIDAIIDAIVEFVIGGDEEEMVPPTEEYTEEEPSEEPTGEPDASMEEEAATEAETPEEG